MKFLSTIFSLFFWIATIFLALPQITFAESLTTITVEVEHSKANGKPWDKFKGKPDLAICLSNSLAGTLCLPEGDRIDNVLSSQCPNSYQCKFSVQAPDQTFKFSVVDVDTALNDPIGIGHCGMGQTCQVGQAVVSIDKKKLRKT